MSPAQIKIVEQFLRVSDADIDMSAVPSG